jgi:hypothetical protein
MKRSTGITWRYSLRAHLAGQLWLPAAIWALFIFLVLTQLDNNAKEIAVTFPVVVMPLLAGITAGYALLEDPALELQLASPVSAARMLLRRLGGQLLIVTVLVALFQAVCAAAGLDLSGYGSLLMRQVFWIVPCLTLSALGCALTLAFSQTTPSVLLISIVWLLQLILRHWIINHNPARYFFLFTGLFFPQHPAANAIQLSLVVITAVLFIISWMLLQRQERYI